MSAADIWLVDLALPPVQIERCAHVLDASERERAERFLRPVDRARFIMSHAALRLVLSGALACRPSSIRITADAFGKPRLADPGEGAIAFNLSHSGARALIGLAEAPSIGVDIEALRPIPDALRIAHGHFAGDETAALADLPLEARASAFFDLWTRKEAVVKALGAGLSLPLDRFSVTVPPAPPRMLRGGEAWTLATIEAGADYAATVAVPATGVTLRHHTLPTDWPDHLG
ncbi:4'-phosphopantetheinyl transferase [Methylobacterium phyllostachyos]|uniref:4'-phosphopantetheinyl transferase n=1 Tax=Methylobacterium phyllostachyos TaxID=582672 RepID=A0A1G9V179_9HYPH|nr:4'-phosphopantetheinyl transferase superfamily protein [Methylobacterium phyllostachyos]SDM65863.1 4'-phosphopantetheinyl transferase [Methylobacterium phyllostachyos]